MMNRVVARRLAVCALVILPIIPVSAQQSAPVPAPSPAPAQAAAEAPFSRTDEAEIEVHEDFRTTYTGTYRGKVLTAAGVQIMGTYRDSFNEHFTRWELVDGATIKPDGRRIPVDRAKVLVQAGQASPDALHFNVDMKTATIIFPEVEVGDVVEAKVRLTSIKPDLPNGASWRSAFSRSSRTQTYKVTVRAPKGMGLSLVQEGLEHTQTQTDDKVVHTLLYTGRPYAPVQTDSIHPIDFEPHFMFTTFKDWQGIAKAFWDSGASKADPTPAVSAKAKDITLGLTDDRRKAEAIFNWVSAKVRYVNIVLGAGGWVPRDADSILSNLFGDCKDHATLMRAMLRAVGVEADYAIVNVAPLYKPYPLPIASFDHIILFLPSLNLYVDPTNSLGQFGEVDGHLQGKPTLRFNGDSATFSVIPRSKADKNVWQLETEMTIGADGKVKGASSISASGMGVVFLRSQARAIASQGLETAATRHITRLNWRGKGRYDAFPQDERAAKQALRASFELDTNFFSGANGGTRIPLGPLPFARPNGRLANFIRDNVSMPFGCAPVAWEEKHIIRLPKGAKLKAVPQGIAIEQGPVKFRSSYELKDETLTATRSFVWDVDVRTCTVASIMPYRPVLMRMARDSNQSRLVLIGENGAANSRTNEADDVE